MSTLKEVRESQFLTQQELADKAGIHKLTVIRIEARDGYTPKFKTMKILAKALKVKPASIDW